MTRVAGVDGAPDGWAVVVSDRGLRCALKVKTLDQLFTDGAGFAVVAVDMPIGLAAAYETGGRECEREARRLLGRRRGSSVFATPPRRVLDGLDHKQGHKEACRLSRGDAGDGKGISLQTFHILPKIEEIDRLLQRRTDLRSIVHEVHPEVCFREMTRAPMEHSKKKREGRAARLWALGQRFEDLDTFLVSGRAAGLPQEDILDAAAACWTAERLANGEGRSLVEPIPRDATGLAMTIWV